MTTGHSPSSDDYDATTALSRFASPQDLERIAETRPDLHSILATNPSIPPRAREILEQSDDAVVQEVLARQAGRGTQPPQPPVPGEIGPMSPTMAVGAGVGTAGTPPHQPVPGGSGYAQVPQEYGGHRLSAPGTAPQGPSRQGPAPQGYGTTAPQSPQGPLPQAPQQPVAPPSATQAYSAPSMQPTAQPVDQQTAMPPGVPSGVPSGHGVGQAYASGQPYGPSQPAAPVYGPPMYAPPAQAPRKRRLLKVIAVVLPVILVLGVGGVAAWYFLLRSEVSLASPYVTPSNAWANGADKAWSADVKADEEPYVFGDHFLTFNRTDGTLTAYSPLGSNMKEVWKTSIDDDDLSSSHNYLTTFQAWGNSTLVHKSTLIDLKTGKTLKAPWGSSNSVLIVGDTAISCKDDSKCTAWSADKKQKWSRTIAGTGKNFDIASMHNGSYLVKNNQHYIAMYNAVINIDTGESLFLGGGSKADSDSATLYFQDGWGTLELENDSDSDSDSSADREYKLTVYDFKGKKQSSFRETLSTREIAVEEDKVLPTAKQHRAHFKDHDFSDASLTAKSNSDGCITSLKPKQGSSITVPEGDDSSDSASCAPIAASSQDGRVVKLMLRNRRDANGISMLMNVKTGKEITFNGINSKGDDTLIIAKPDLIIGYDKDAGKVIGFKPAS